MAQHENLEIPNTDTEHLSVIQLPRAPVVDWVPMSLRAPPSPGRYLVTEAFDVHDEGVSTRAVNVMYFDGSVWFAGGYRQIIAWAVAPGAWEG